MKLVSVTSGDKLDKIYDLYMEAFPQSERKPFALMLKKCEEGSMEIFAIEDEEEKFLGLGIMVLDGDLALLDYFAISPVYRAAGVGTKAFGLLKEQYADKRFFLEIESTIGEQEELELKKRRKNFYKRNSMTEMPYLVWLFGVEMEILTHSCRVDYQEYFDMYCRVFGNQVSRNISLYRDL